MIRPQESTRTESLDTVQLAAREQFGNRSHKYGTGHILEDVTDVLAAVKRIPLAAKSQVLDVATGAGHTGLCLASLGHDVTIADIAEPMLTHALARAESKGLKIRTSLHPAEKFPHPDGAFQLVTCRVAAHHFSSPKEFVEEAARVLRPEGWLLVIDGSVEDDQPEAEAWLHEVETLRDPSHNRFLSPDAWRRLCEQSGLRLHHLELTPFKQPDVQWYFETAATTPENRARVLDLIRTAPDSARRLFRLAEEDGKIVWWWQRLTLLARKVS